MLIKELKILVYDNIGIPKRFKEGLDSKTKHFKILELNACGP